MGATTAGPARERTLPRVRLLLLFLAAVALSGTAPARAQDEGGPAAPQPQDDQAARGREEGRAAWIGRFLLGGAAGLGLHEGGHVLFDGVFGVRPVLKKVDFGGIPFVAISHRAGLPPRREFTITSAGFWMQHLSSEIIFARHPRLHDQRAPVVKGILVFNVLASIAYGGAALAKAGPAERDTRAMADALGVNEAWVGVLVLVPAGLDAWRYFHPEARWAKWLSRGVKVGSVLLVLR